MTSFAALAPFPVIGKWEWDEMQFKWLLMKWWLHFVVWNVRPAEMLIRWWQSLIQVIVDCCWILHMFCCDFISVITVTVGHFGGTTFTSKADNYAGAKGHQNCECSRLQINSCLIGRHLKSLVSHQQSSRRVSSPSHWHVPDSLSKGPQGWTDDAFWLIHLFLFLFLSVFSGWHWSIGC